MARRTNPVAHICACGNHAFANATRAAVALVSPEDFPVLANRLWVTHPKGYIQSCGQRLHREIVGAPAGFLVDHKNHDRADCRRSNLRLVTDAQSVRNRRKLRRNQSPASPYIGVHRNGSGWIARICIDGRRISVGTYSTDVAAARAYDAAAIQYVGEFAHLNFGR